MPERKCDCGECKRCKHRTYMAEYVKTPKGRAAHRRGGARYRTTPDGKAAGDRSHNRYVRTDKGRAKRQEHMRAERASGRAAARQAVSYHVRVGNLVRQPCVVCGAAAQAHHPRGYDKAHRLDVEWYCPKHHREVHR